MAVTESPRYVAEGPGVIRARARCVDPAWHEKLKACWSFVGLSADQNIRGQRVESNGESRLRVDAIVSVRCVDFVTRANAGGKVTAVLEGYDPDEIIERGGVRELQWRDITVEGLIANRPDVVGEIATYSREAMARVNARAAEARKARDPVGFAKNVARGRAKFATEGGGAEVASRERESGGEADAGKAQRGREKFATG